MGFLRRLVVRENIRRKILQQDAIISNLDPGLCTYQRPSREIDPGDIWGKLPIFGSGQGHWTAFALPRQDTRGKTCGICNIAAILKMEDPDRVERLPKW